jgi:hypothetical protein
MRKVPCVALFAAFCLVLPPGLPLVLAGAGGPPASARGKALSENTRQSIYRDLAFAEEGARQEVWQREREPRVRRQIEARQVTARTAAARKVRESGGTVAAANQAASDAGDAAALAVHSELYQQALKGRRAALARRYGIALAQVDAISKEGEQKHWSRPAF